MPSSSVPRPKAMVLTPDVAKYRITAKPNGGDPVSKDIEIDGAAVYRLALSIKPREN